MLSCSDVRKASALRRMKNAHEVGRLLPHLVREATLLEARQEEPRHAHVDLHERCACRQMLERLQGAHHRLGRLEIADVEDDDVVRLLHCGVHLARRSDVRGTRVQRRGSGRRRVRLSVRTHTARVRGGSARVGRPRRYLRLALAPEPHAPVLRVQLLGPVREALTLHDAVERHGLEDRAHAQHAAGRQRLARGHDAGERLAAGAQVLAHVQVHDAFRRERQEELRLRLPNAGRRGRFPWDLHHAPSWIMLGFQRGSHTRFGRTSLTPGTAESAFRIPFVMCRSSGQPGVVSV